MVLISFTIIDNANAVLFNFILSEHFCFAENYCKSLWTNILFTHSNMPFYHFSFFPSFAVPFILLFSLLVVIAAANKLLESLAKTINHSLDLWWRTWWRWKY